MERRQDTIFPVEHVILFVEPEGVLAIQFQVEPTEVTILLVGNIVEVPADPNEDQEIPAEPPPNEPVLTEHVRVNLLLIRPVPANLAPAKVLAQPETGINLNADDEN